MKILKIKIIIKNTKCSKHKESKQLKNVNRLYFIHLDKNSKNIFLTNQTDP